MSVSGVCLNVLGIVLILRPARYHILGGMLLDPAGYNVYLGIGLVAAGLGIAWESLRGRQ